LRQTTAVFQWADYPTSKTAKRQKIVVLQTALHSKLNSRHTALGCSKVDAISTGLLGFGFIGLINQILIHIKELNADIRIHPVSILWANL
jgi:hypothetical protein